MLKNKVIKDLSHREYTYDELIQNIKELDKIGAKFYIGTDSKVIKKKISIVTCICALTSKGNEVFYIKDKISKNDLKNMQMPEFVVSETKDRSALRLRMLLEGYRSLEVAMEIEPLIKNKLHVHLDVGTDIKNNKSAIASKELEYLVQAQGYECSMKPDAWAASAVADKVVNKRSK